MNRVAMLIALVGLVVLTRRLGLAHRDALGYGLPRANSCANSASAGCAGSALMLPLVGAAARPRRPRSSSRVSTATWLALIARWHRSRARRGVHRRDVLPRRAVHGGGTHVQASLRRSSRRACCTRAAALPRRQAARAAGRRCRGMHGFDVLSRLFERYARAAGVRRFVHRARDAGRAAALVRLRTGAIAGCIGLHAAGVCDDRGPAQRDDRQSASGACGARRHVRRRDRLGGAALVRRDRGRRTSRWRRRGSSAR